MNCLYCDKVLERTHPRANNRKFCNITCRNKARWLKERSIRIAEQRAKSGAYAENKKQCLMCEGWYVKPMAHVWQRHHLTEKEYKAHFDLPLSKGIIPAEHRQLLRELALENDMDKQLRVVGVRTRYKKGDPKAVKVTGWKGRTGSKGYQE